MNESTVERCQAMETSDFKDAAWHQPILNCLNLGWINMQSLRGDDIDKKGQAIHHETVLLWIGE